MEIIQQSRNPPLWCALGCLANWLTGLNSELMERSCLLKKKQKKLKNNEQKKSQYSSLKESFLLQKLVLFHSSALHSTDSLKTGNAVS